MTLEAKIRITAQLDQAVKAMGTLKAEIAGVKEALRQGRQPAFAQVGAGATDAASKVKAAKKEADDLNAAASKSSTAKPFAALNEGASALGSNVAQLRGVVTQFFAAVAGIELGRNTIALIDAYAGLTARLRVTTGSQLLYNQALEAARGLSAQYQTGLADTAKLIDRVYASIAPLGGTLGNATTATEALLAALKISGATAEETSSAILQFSQALGKGVLNGDEFNSINEAAPGLLRALGTALGKSTADLKKMGEQGTLTSDVIIKAANIALPQLRKQAADIGPTIGGSFTAVNNALLEFIGKGAQANGTARVIAGGMKLLAENVGLVVNGLGLLTGAALIGGLFRLAAALPPLSVGIAGVGLAIRGVLGFLTGPVGLIVTLASLAAAWIGVDKAQRAATDRTVDRIKAERDSVQVIVDRLNAKNDADKASGVSTATAGRQKALERNLATLRQLDAEIAKIEKKADTAGGEVAIRADGPLKQKLEENKGKRKLDEEYARDRELIEQQSATKIAALRREGRNAEADRLAIDATQSLARLKKSHDDAIKSLTKDETNTRLAQYIAEYDRIAELVADGTARELKAVQSGFDQQLLSTKAYFEQRGRLEDESTREAIGRIESEIASRRAVIERNSKVRTSSANEAAALAEANKRELEAINKLEVDRVKAQRDLTGAAQNRAIEEGKATDQLLRQRQEVDFQIKAASDSLTLADERLRLENRYAEARRREFAETGDTAQTDQLIATQLRLTELTRLKAKFSDLNHALVLQEAELALSVEQGALTTEEAEKRKFDARAASIPQLEQILLAMQALAKTDAERNALEEARQRILGLKIAVIDLQAVAKSSAISSLTTALTDIATGAKSGKAALLDMVSSFAKAMLDVLSKRLAQTLVDQFLKAGKDAVASGEGGFLATVFKIGAGLFHSGGVVGAGGGASRNVSPALFNFAPRYHSGGIAGLRPREVPAILNRGEEVLTEEDPRHRNNFRPGAGGVTVSVTINGAQGSEAQQQGAGDALGRALQGAVRGEIDRWATRESRNGGILASARGR